jgi:hypothetical protein
VLSNSARRQLLRVRLVDGAAVGMPEVVAQRPSGADDFVVAADGTVYTATHGVGLARLLPGAAMPQMIAASGVEGSTAVALTPDGLALYALGALRLPAGGHGDAVLARVPLTSA